MKTIIIIIFSLGILFSNELTAIYYIDGMMCEQNCPHKVNESLKDIKGIKSCKVDFKSKTATITYDSNQINSNTISEIITNKTYYKIKEKTKNQSFWSKIFRDN